MSYGRGPPDIRGMVSLKVDNLTYRTTPEDLKRAFEKYGDVGDVYIPRDRFSRESRGFAFVRFFHNRDAEDAMESMDGAIVDGREMRVQLAKYGRPSEPPRRGPPRRRDKGRSRSRSRGRYHSRSGSRSRSRSRTPYSHSRSRSTRSRSVASRSGSRSRSRSPSKSRSKSPERCCKPAVGVNAAAVLLSGLCCPSGGEQCRSSRAPSAVQARSRSLNSLSSHKFGIKYEKSQTAVFRALWVKS